MSGSLRPAREDVPTGYAIREPGPTELLLDIDSEDDLNFMRQQLAVLKSNEYRFTLGPTIPSKTLGHYHVSIRASFKPSPIERILLQAVLGSDRKRELLSFLRSLQCCLSPHLMANKRYYAWTCRGHEHTFDTFELFVEWLKFARDVCLGGVSTSNVDCCGPADDCGCDHGFEEEEREKLEEIGVMV